MSRANESAYPLIGQRWSETTLGEREVCSTGGLTIREHFAAMAMWSPRNPHNAFDHKAATLWALMEADALLKRLAK